MGDKCMKFDIYGRYRPEVIRRDESWVVYRVDNGKRRKEFDMVMPSSMRAEETPTYTKEQ